MLKIVVSVFIALSLMLCSGAYPVFRSSDPPEKLELARNWKVFPAIGLTANGAALSTAILCRAKEFSSPRAKHEPIA